MPDTENDRSRKAFGPYDVVIVGGGPSGAAAAVSCGRLGKKVLLVEESGSLGGAASNCLIFPFMPYTTGVKTEDGSTKLQYLSQGFLTELVHDLEKAGGIRGNSHFDTELLKFLLDQKLTEAGVQVLFHAKLCSVCKEGRTIRGIQLATKAGVIEVSASYFIDATGDADLTALSGVPTHLGREEDGLCQPMTLCFRMINVDKQRFFDSNELWQRLYKEWQSEGRISNPRENILVFDYPAEGVVHFNTTRVVKLNPVDPFDVSKAEMLARKQVFELIEFFKENHVPGMENAVLMMTASSIGARESRMLRGEYVLSGKDLLNCEKYDDAIAAGNYDIDIHNPEGSGTSHYYFPEGTWYTIPYRSLIPKAEDCENLLVSGRCISCSHEAQASIRIMPICVTLGEACGVAAAVCADGHTSVQRADVKKIQGILRETGAFLGI